MEQREARFMIGEMEFLVVYGVLDEREDDESTVDMLCSCCRGVMHQEKMHKPLFGVIDVQVDTGTGMKNASIDLLGEMGEQIEEMTLPFALGVESAMCKKCQEEDVEAFREIC